MGPREKDVEEEQNVAWVSTTQWVCRRMKWNHHVSTAGARHFSPRSRLRHREAQHGFRRTEG